MLQKAFFLLPMVLATAVSIDAQTRQVSREQMLQQFQAQSLARVVEFSESGQIQDIGAEASYATISPNRAIFTRIGTVTQPAAPPSANLAETSRFVRLPIGFATTNPDATETLFLRPIVEIEQGGLQYQDGEYRGRIGITLEDRDNPTVRTPISPAVHLSVTAIPASTSPTALTLDHTNLPFERISLVTQRDVESVTVKVRTEMDPETSDVEVFALRPALILEASPQRIAGFGLAETNLTVSIDQIIDQAITARLTSDTGAPSPQEVSIPRGGTATSVLRSAGLGSAKVLASAAMFETGSQKVDFVFPTSFLISTILGGAIGGLASVLLTAKEKRKVTWPRRLIGGVCVGFVVAVLFAVGVNLTGYTFKAKSGEALFFGVSALASIAGLSIFERRRAA